MQRKNSHTNIRIILLHSCLGLFDQQPYLSILQLTIWTGHKHVDFGMSIIKGSTTLSRWWWIPCILVFLRIFLRLFARMNNQRENYGIILKKDVWYDKVIIGVHEMLIAQYQTQSCNSYSYKMWIFLCRTTQDFQQALVNFVKKNRTN